MIAEATALLASMKKFNTAQDGPSGDAECDAACEMRDAAMAFLEKTAECALALSSLIQTTDIEAEEPSEEGE